MALDLCEVLQVGRTAMERAESESLGRIAMGED